ncbi:MAG TPA: hypothetical protein EYP57_03285 [Thermodesulfobacteriaceae bacterium]|nr:hypothetical protein [Thermodesulfobacteriaceae bacterium]
MKNSFSVLFLLLTMAGCITKSVPPPDVYTILPEWHDSATVLPAQQIRNPIVVRMATIQAARTYTGTDIIYSDSEYSRECYAYSRWNDSPVKLLRILFHAILERSGLFRAVVSPASSAGADLILEGRLYDFSHHVEDDGSSWGVVRVRFYLIDSETRTVTATKEFVSRAAAPSVDAHGAVAALNSAAREVAWELVTWLAGTGL